MNFTGPVPTSAAGCAFDEAFKENIKMATRTRTAKSTFASKSDHARALFLQGKSIAQVTKEVPNMGYAFAYGVAKRLEKTNPEFNIRMVAQERQTKQIFKSGDAVIITTQVGKVVVNLVTGKVSKTK